MKLVSWIVNKIYKFNGNSRKYHQKYCLSHATSKNVWQQIGNCIIKVTWDIYIMFSTKNIKNYCYKKLASIMVFKWALSKCCITYKSLHDNISNLLDFMF